MWQVGLPSPATFFTTHSLRAILQLQEEGRLQCHFTSPPTRLLQLFFSFITTGNHKGERQNGSTGFHKPCGGTSDVLQTTKGQKRGKGKGEKQCHGTRTRKALEHVTSHASRAPTVDLWRRHRCSNDCPFSACAAPPSIPGWLPAVLKHQ